MRDAFLFRLTDQQVHQYRPYYDKETLAFECFESYDWKKVRPATKQETAHLIREEMKCLTINYKHNMERLKFELKHANGVK